MHGLFGRKTLGLRFCRATAGLFGCLRNARLPFQQAVSFLFARAALSLAALPPYGNLFDFRLFRAGLFFQNGNATAHSSALPAPRFEFIPLCGECGIQFFEQAIQGFILTLQRILLADRTCHLIGENLRTLFDFLKRAPRSLALEQK